MVDLPQGVRARTITSFVKRDGRVTEKQHYALENGFPQWGLDADIHSPENWQFDWAEIYGNQQAPIVEIGIGNGDNIVAQAAANPDKNYLGIEVYKTGIGRALIGVEKHQLKNLRLICDDAVEVMTRRIADNSVGGLWLFFPDPWHKTRHHKRRIIQTEFVTLAASKLQSEAIFHMATDWEPYAAHMLKVMEAHSAFSNINGNGVIAARPESRIETHFERRGIRRGHKVGDLLYRRLND